MIQIDPANPRGIVWLASFPRSGNTWLRVFLACLRRAIDDDPAALDLDRLDEAFLSIDVAAVRFQEVLGKPPLAASNAEIAAARAAVLRRIVERSRGIALIKTHSANATLYGARLIPPEVSAGAVYIVRNPLDVAISAASFRGIGLDQAIGQLGTSGLSTLTDDAQVYTILGSWSENVLTWTATAHPSLLVVRYEDMLERPAETFAAVAAHLAMRATPQQLATAIAASSFERLAALEGRNGFAERPGSADRFFRVGRAGQWRGILSPAQVDRIVTDHAPQMARFGYLPA